MNQPDGFRNELEKKVFDRYYGKFTDFVRMGGDVGTYKTLDQALDAFERFDLFSDRLLVNYEIDHFFEPEFGITLKDLLAILKENRTTFGQYVRGILCKPEFGLEGKLKRDRVVFGYGNKMSEGILDKAIDGILNNQGFMDKAQKLIGDILGGSGGDSEADEDTKNVLKGILSDGDDDNGSMSADDSDEVKKSVVKTALGNDKVDLNDLSSDELDEVVSNVSGINEKVMAIMDYLREKNDETIANVISSYTGMKMSEALEIIREY